MNFEQVYALADRSSSECAFNQGECLALYNLLRTLPYKAVVVEIGVQFGRSTTVIGAVAKELDFEFTAIDNWSGEEGQQQKEHIEKLLIGEFELPINLVSSDSAEACKYFHREIDLIHIDGDHEYEAVMLDMRLWLPKLKSGGYVCFDDYGHDSLPDVYRAVSEYIKPEDYRFLGRYGEKLGIFKKL